MIYFQNLNIYFNIKHMQPKKKNCLTDCNNSSESNIKDNKVIEKSIQNSSSINNSRVVI